MVVTVLSQFFTLMVVRLISTTLPSAPYFGTSIQSSMRTISFPEIWMEATSPRMVSRKVRMIRADRAPNAVSSVQRGLSVRLLIMKRIPTQ